MVNSCRFHYDRQVSAGPDRKRMTDDLVPEEFRIFFFQSQTIIQLVFVPLLQLDHQIDRMCILDALNTK